ncbi:unnamed protein product [Penicillium discolor]
MQFINASALAFSLFWVSGLASPTPQAGWKTTATLQLANDQSGANANVPVPIDGVKYSVQELWGHTAVAQHGLVFASSAQVTAFDQTTSRALPQPWMLSAPGYQPMDGRLICAPLLLFVNANAREE